MAGLRTFRSRSCDSASVAAALLGEVDPFGTPPRGGWLAEFPAPHGDAGSAWPAGRSEKTLLKRKVLRPLSPRAMPLGAAFGQADGASVPVVASPPLGRPPLFPSRPASDEVLFRKRAVACGLAAAAPPRAASPPRPSSGSGERPRTAGSRNRPPLGGDVAFPAQLHLRGPGDPSGPQNPFASPGECLVIPLETQYAIRSLAAACGEGRSFVRDGTLLTAWALVSEGSGSAAPHVLEPLAARKVDCTFAVEPIELAVERLGAHYADDVDGQVSLRYGEGFRLRAAGCSTLYLCHGGAAGGLCWRAPSSGASPSSTPVPPPHSRFAAHGGELGAPLLMGRPVLLQRVVSPPPSPEESEVSDSDCDSDGSFAPPPRRCVPRQGSGRSQEPKSKVEVATAAALTQVFLPETRQYQAEGLFSRAGDSGGVFPVTFLPLS